MFRPNTGALLLEIPKRASQSPVSALTFTFDALSELISLGVGARVEM
jgi:hypothetical protein